MTGDRLHALLRALLHEDTYALCVAPAIADLQHAPSPHAYAAVWTSFAGALYDDFAGDVDYLLNDIGLMLALVAMQSCYYGGMLLLLVAHIRADQMLERLARGGGTIVTATALAVVLASLVPTLLCFWPPRRTLDV
jgi:hypothetical protein